MIDFMILIPMQETLRVHPIIYTLIRRAARDDVIPLSQPILDSSGNPVESIPISAGQSVFVSVAAYQR